MELIAVGMIAGVIVFVSVIGYSLASKHISHSRQFDSIRLEQERQAIREKEKQLIEGQINALKLQLVEEKQRSRNFKYRLDRAVKDNELDLDDVDIDENQDTPGMIGDIAKALFPKMPDSLKELLDKESFQEAIFKFAEKNPERIGTWIDKFVKKAKPESQDQTNKDQTVYL